MLKIGISNEEQLVHLTQVIAKRVLVSPRNLFPFASVQELLPHLLTALSPRSSLLISAGHISPDISIAADRAGMNVTEQLGVSPFSASVDAALSGIVDGSELLYVANPNRVTGANFGFADLESLVQAIPNGFLLIDEYYFDYFGITGLTLLEKYANVGVLRSFATAFGIESSDSGYLVASAELIQHLRTQIPTSHISTTVYRTAMLCLESDSALDMRLKTLHAEAMRVSTELTRFGLQNRITAADFLMLRVKDPVAVGNQLARYKVPCENLDGYPLLKGYLRYKVQSPLSNDRMLDAIERMPAELYRMSEIEKRVVTMKHAGEDKTTVTNAVPESRTKRVARVVKLAQWEKRRATDVVKR